MNHEIHENHENDRLLRRVLRYSLAMTWEVGYDD